MINFNINLTNLDGDGVLLYLNNIDGIIKFKVYYISIFNCFTKGYLFLSLLSNVK